MIARGVIMQSVIYLSMCVGPESGDVNTL